MKFRDLFGLRGAIHQGGVAKGFDAFWFGAVAVNRARRDCVDPDAIRTELSRPGPAHRSQRGLGRAIGSAAGKTDAVGHAVDADDAAPTGLRHPRGEHGD